MKKIILILTFLSNFISLFGQDKDIKLSDLNTPNSPGFQLLDISPSSIERPTNPKEFSLKFLNLFNNGNAIPKNFAFEFSPFWYVKKKNESVYKYLGVGEIKNKSGEFDYKITSGLFRKSNFSFASTFSDSTSGSLLKNTNYVTFGGKTNVITIRSKAQNKEINEALLVAARRIDINMDDPSIPIDELEKNIDADTTYMKALKVANKLPLLQLDAAFAYSDAFLGNSFSKRRFNRMAGWVSLAINADLKKENQDNHSLSLILLVKTTRDNVLKDTIKYIFNEDHSLDFGGKIEYSINRFNLALEYINRSYDSNKNFNSERTVGLIQYKINDNLYATGTYGKNFGNINNVFSLIGLNWGFGTSKLSTENPNTSQ